MKIRTKLSIWYTLITATILFVFTAVIYYTAKGNREREFYTALKKEAVTKANLFFNARVNRKTLQDIYRSNRQILNEVEVAIYDTAFNLLYHDAVDIDYVKETKEMIDHIAVKGEIRYYQQDWQVIGLRYGFHGDTYIVTATAYDEYGYNKLNSLFRTMVIVFVLSILVIYIVGYLFARHAFAPVKQMTGKVVTISATNLDLRLKNKKSKDELSELALTFNNMLDRLENSFDAQKHFVSNISHELRTPLAAIITELELSTNKERSKEEYKRVIEYTLSDARKLVRLSNNLLDLAKASYDPVEIAFKPVRIDEVLLDARQQVQKANPDYKIDIQFSSELLHDAAHQHMTINGNMYLLTVAFVNLFENGCKFSKDKKSTVFISFWKQEITLKFVDQGIGIAPEDIPHIFDPFYRGKNGTHTEGNGIGLSLTHKIILLHQGRIAVYSAVHKGATFTLELKNM